jgi:HSP20 family molecular chaperone IbpA
MSQRFFDRIRKAWDSVWGRGSSVQFVRSLEFAADRPLVRPAVDVLESDTEWLVEVDLPGVSASDAKLRLDPSGTLEVHGRSAEAPADFLCQVRLSSGIDLEHAKATLKNGVLTVRVPRVREALGKQIQARLVS